MLYVKYFILVAFATVSYGLSFGQESFVNELLNDHVYMGRLKRSPPREACCGEEPDMKDEELIEKCGGDMGKPTMENRDEMMKKSLCMMGCLMNETKMLVDGNIVEKEVFEKIVDEKESDSFRSDQLKKSYEKCIEEAKVFQEKIKNAFPDVECDPTPAGFGHCQMREMIMNCPPDKWNDIKPCQMLKSMLQKKDDM